VEIKHTSQTEVVESGENLSALLFLTLGSKYFNLVHNVLGETVKLGNPHVISSDTENFLEDYFEKTKWSDFMIIEPVLFNFYHGVELLLKGLLLLTEQPQVKATHTLSSLFHRAEGVASIPNEMKEIIREYVIAKGNDVFFAPFLVENQLSIDDLYESLRYPSDRNFTSLNNYFSLHYNEEKAIKFFEKIMIDIRTLQKMGTILYRETVKQKAGLGSFEI